MNNKIEKQKAHFENISDTYFVARQGSNHLLLKELMWGYALNTVSLQLTEPIQVLEPMCGYCEGKSILSKHLGLSIDYEGFDYSRPLVERVKRLYPTENVYEMDVTQYQPDRQFDIVIIIGGLHHVPDYSEQVLKTVFQALRPGGYFINYEPTHNNWILKKIRQSIYEKNDIFDQQTERAFDYPHLKELYASAGFLPQLEMYPGLLSYVLYYNPDAFPILNVGGDSLVRFCFYLDRFFLRNWVGRKLTFATLSILQRPGN